MSAPSELMKSANAYGSASSPAQIALCGEEPSSHGTGSSGRPGQHAGEPCERMVLGEVVVEVREQLGQLLGEVVGRGLTAVALERERGHRVGAGGPAEAEVDPAREQAGEDRERLGDLERAVVGQHHAAAPDPDALGGGRDRADQRLGARAREHRASVVLGDPVTVIAELVGEPGEVDRVAQRVGAGRAFGDRGLVEDG